MAYLLTVFLLPCFFSSLSANANKFSVSIDIAVVVMIDWPQGEIGDQGHERKIDWVESVAHKFTDQFEMGEDKAKMALIAAVTRALAGGFELLQPLTAVEADFKKKASEWSKKKYDEWISMDYAKALESARTQLLTKNDNRKKAVFITLAEALVIADNVTKAAMADISKQLRGSGCKIYALVKEGDSDLMKFAENITEDPNNVVVFKGIIFDNTVADLIPKVSKLIAEGAGYTTPGGFSAPGGPTTTTGVAQPTPLLQLLGCVLIGEQLLLLMFAF